jgi:hypothetical protein
VTNSKGKTWFWTLTDTVAVMKLLAGKPTVLKRSPEIENVPDVIPVIGVDTNISNCLAFAGLTLTVISPEAHIGTLGRAAPVRTSPSVQKSPRGAAATPDAPTIGALYVTKINGLAGSVLAMVPTPEVKLKYTGPAASATLFGRK